jgi:PAS domain S-box-containing protein
MTGATNIWRNDARLAAHALSPTPAWLWSHDATRILWANPTGAAIMQAASPAALEAMRFDVTQTSAAQIARLAGTLPNGAIPRLERLRGFGAGIGSPLTCICSRIELTGTPPQSAILVVATERAGPDLALNERLRWLIGDSTDALAAFSASGELLLASTAAHARLGGAADLDALGAQALARQASWNGHVEGRVTIGDVTLDRLGAGKTPVLLLSFPSGEAAAAPIAETVAAPVLAPEIPAPDNAATPVASAPVAAVTTPVVSKPRPSLRFVWNSDADDRLTIESDEFLALAGWKTKAALGSAWPDFATALALDADGRIAAAFASRTTWSGIAVQWPVDGTEDHVAVELSGLPTFSREQVFQGYRGFGVCREPQKLAVLAQQREEAEAVAKAAEAKKPAVLATKTEDTKSQDNEAAANVVQFRAPVQDPTPALDAREQKAFSDLARELTDRLKSTNGKPINDDDFGPERHEPIAETPNQIPSELTSEPASEPANQPPRVAAVAPPTTTRDAQIERPILDRLPIGVLVYRLNDLLYANRAFLEWTEHPSLESLIAAGGLDSLFIETNAPPAGTAQARENARTLTIATPNGKRMPVEGRLFPAQWGGESALVLMLNITKAVDKSAGLATRQVEDENRELKAVLDTATDGVLLVDRAGRILSANRSAEALFGYDAAEFTDLSFGDLFAPESRRTVLDHLDKLAGEGTLALLNDGKEVIGRVHRGGLVPLYVTIGRIGESSGKFCAVFRDITAWKKSEEELINARRQAEYASSAKSEFLAKISHEIRTPLNAIIGFSEVMMDERFGPVGNERYRQYLRDIHTSGGHLISLLNDLLDLSKIESGKLDLTFTGVNLNDIAQQCVAILQEQANRERVIIRTSLPPALPQIVADARSVRQIVLNLLSNSIKFTGAGGQVIVSTAITDRNEVALRVRDTGAGMSEHELQTALEPFRQLATSSRWGSSGTGLGLPITKALAEANRATFTIKSAVDDGTLVEVAFPTPRVLTK